MFTWLLVSISVLLGVFGQLLMKKGMMVVGTLDIFSITQIVKTIMNPFVFFGFVSYGISSILWLSVISKLPLSVAYPILSIGYVLVIFASYFLFKEPLTITKIIGAVLICLGVGLIGRG